MRHRLAAILLVAVTLSCDSPSAPRSDLLPPQGPLPATATYRVSGLITNEEGAPIPRTMVLIDQGPRLPDLNEQTKRIIASAGPDGRYDIVLSGEYVQTPQPVFGVIKAWTLTTGYVGYAQLLDGQGTSAVRNIRLSRTRLIDAGQSIELVVGPDSSLCPGANLSLTTICEPVIIRYSQEGTVSVQAQPAGGIVATVRRGSHAGQGSLSFPVSTEDFNSTGVEIELPIGTPAQRFVVSTSFQAF